MATLMNGHAQPSVVVVWFPVESQFVARCVVALWRVHQLTQSYADPKAQTIAYMHQCAWCPGCSFGCKAVICWLTCMCNKQKWFKQHKSNHCSPFVHAVVDFLPSSLQAGPRI